MRAKLDAVDAIREANAGRSPGLLRIKYARMGADMFSFFRGTDHLYAAAWVGLAPVDPGPSVLVSGDLHLENFGVYRAEDGDFVFDINDFDEALVGPCSLDLVRCSTSILLAAQVWSLSPIQGMRMVLGYLESYRDAIAISIAEGEIGQVSLVDKAGPVEKLLGDCSLGTQSKLLDRLTRLDKSGRRTIRNSAEKLPPLDKTEAAVVAGAVEEYGRRQGRAGAYSVLDVSGRIAGIGSLGVERFVALIEGTGSPDGNRLLDIKAAGPPSLIRLATGPLPETWAASQARRVVEAQRILQAKPTSGLDVLAVGDKEFRLRELIPDENRAKLDRFREKPSKLREAVAVAGRITAWSQLRGARFAGGDDRAKELAEWAASPALDALLASAARFAEQNRADYKAFKKARLNEELAGS